MGQGNEVSRTGRQYELPPELGGTWSWLCEIANERGQSFILSRQEVLERYKGIIAVNAVFARQGHAGAVELGRDPETSELKAQIRSDVYVLFFGDETYKN